MKKFREGSKADKKSDKGKPESKESAKMKKGELPAFMMKGKSKK